jgi:hypothetical protein
MARLEHERAGKNAAHGRESLFGFAGIEPEAGRQLAQQPAKFSLQHRNLVHEDIEERADVP